MTKRRIDSAFPFVDEFDALRSDLPGAPLDWLQVARRDALARFHDKALPNAALKTGSTQILALLRILTLRLPTAQSATCSPGVFVDAGSSDAVRLVIANGRVDPALSNTAGLPAGVHLVPMSAALDSHGVLLQDHITRISGLDGNGLVALNTAFMMDGYVLIVDEDAKVDPTIEVIFAGDGGRGLWRCIHATLSSWVAIALPLSLRRISEMACTGPTR